MSNEFDPYHRWLGIRPEEQPADHYRLLGIVRFEDDPEVILDASERQIRHVRSYELGEQRALAQEILNELARAKACLLNAEKKDAYDEQLREQMPSASRERIDGADDEQSGIDDSIADVIAMESDAEAADEIAEISWADLVPEEDPPPREAAPKSWEEPARPTAGPPQELSTDGNLGSADDDAATVANGAQQVLESDETPSITMSDVAYPTALAATSRSTTQVVEGEFPSFEKTVVYDVEPVSTQSEVEFEVIKQRRFASAFSKLWEYRPDATSIKQLRRTALIGILFVFLFGLLIIPIRPQRQRIAEKFPVVWYDDYREEEELEEEDYDEQAREEVELMDHDRAYQITWSDAFDVEKPVEIIFQDNRVNQRVFHPILVDGNWSSLARSNEQEQRRPFYLRRPGGRSAGVRRGGGNKGSESAVEAALRWLASHQNSDGSWSWKHSAGDKCSGFANPGEKESRMGATGMALMPFLGAGYTHLNGKYKYVVSKGIRYLVGNMIANKKVGRLFEANGTDNEHMYCHGIAACALAEAYGMTDDHSLHAPAQLAINYIVQSQHPGTGGWLYTPRQAPGSTSVMAWQIMALKSAVLSRLRVSVDVKPLANKWLDSVQWNVPNNGSGIGASYGYRKPNDRGDAEATTAIGLLCRNYLGAQKSDPGLQMGVELLSGQGPHRSDMYYNYYATQVMYQNNGPDGKMWKSWNAAMRDWLINTQVKKGTDMGSWFFDGGQGGKAGGRVYCTAMAAMTLEVYYRYPFIYAPPKTEERDDFPLE